MPTRPPRNITFLTGTRAEFGLMLPTLRAIQCHPNLRLSLIATGMHLDPTHGNSINEIRRQGFHINATIPWPPAPPRKPTGGTRGSSSQSSLAAATGNAIAKIAPALDRLKTDILLVVGDRVEAFAGAAAAHLSHRTVAHVHGGDRALGQLDDSLRHAITKLAHLHFPATAQSAARIRKLGEDPNSVFQVGSPGLDGIKQLATPTHSLRTRYNVRPHSYALLLLHPASPDPALEEQRARIVLSSALESFDRLVIVYPNNDPGSAGILKVWRELERANIQAVSLHPDLPRAEFLGLMRDAAILLGNSSSGIIEAASFGTPVLDIGPRQLGRQVSANVRHCDYDPRAMRRHLHDGRPPRFRGVNVYGKGSASASICRVLATHKLEKGAQMKLISY